MKGKNKFILYFLSITLLLMFTVAYASEDKIEYDVIYTVTTAENVTTLNAIFTVTNNETATGKPSLIVAIYDDERMVNMQTAQPTIHLLS